MNAHNQISQKNGLESRERSEPGALQVGLGDFASKRLLVYDDGEARDDRSGRCYFGFICSFHVP